VSLHLLEQQDCLHATFIIQSIRRVASMTGLTICRDAPASPGCSPGLFFRHLFLFLLFLALTDRNAYNKEHTRLRAQSHSWGKRHWKADDHEPISPDDEEIDFSSL